MSSFPRFDVVPEEAKDHRYANRKPCYRPAHATIMREWKILSKSLPESIFVRSYEDRIDLLRAVIIGSSGTPYHDGLFFFDIRLPPDYPKSAPYVYYHSHGYRLNPNLYANGTLCLSLIGTWWGSGQENWTEKSTILQLLISLQGLVLNSKPFFNEPAYASNADSKRGKWIKWSLQYNEDAFVLSCKTMMHIMRNPPEHFEEFVARHFDLRLGAILSAISCYKEGRATVGEDTTKSNAAAGGIRSVRAKFKRDLERIEAEFGGGIFGDVEAGGARRSEPTPKKMMNETQYHLACSCCLLSVLLLLIFGVFLLCQP